MNAITLPSREQIVHQLYEAAELEHNLMCTYLYAAFSLKVGEAEGLSAVQAEAVARWRRELLGVAIEEMSHLAMVWNITLALGAAPRVGRGNFPLDPGYLPARINVKLAPFNADTLQHFVYLERPHNSAEPEGKGFEPALLFTRREVAPRITPMAMDYDTVGVFYDLLQHNLVVFDAAHPGKAFNGDRAFQFGPESGIPDVKPVACLQSALRALRAIVEQGEGAERVVAGSHYARFVAIREELQALSAADPNFTPAHPAATNPVLRRPPKPEGRVWIEDEDAVACVDLANASYALMLRLLAQAANSRGAARAMFVELGIGLMRAMTPLAEQAARLPAGASNVGCNAGMSFTALRDTSPFPSDAPALRFFTERFALICGGVAKLAERLPTERLAAAQKAMAHLRAKADRGLPEEPKPTTPTTPTTPTPTTAVAAASPSSVQDGIERVEAPDLTLVYEAKRCIHARHCVTGAPTVFLANVQGPWLHPETVPAAQVIEIAHACPSGAIRYERRDGQPEPMPPVNLIAVREAGPYAVRAEMFIDGVPAGTRATLCRCGASKNKPFCDGSHHDAGFTASGEPITGVAGAHTEMLAVRGGRLDIELEPDGPLAVRGPLEITAGTGRMVCRIASGRLCRCGGSASKPFCDGTHKTNGFRS